MASWEFRDPLLLLLSVLIVPVVYGLAARSSSAVQYSSLSLIDQAPRTLRARLTKLPALLFSLAVVALAIAMAGPRTPDAETKVSREGIAIAMVVDRSGSMNARDMVQGDVSVDRLAAVKQVFRQFVLGDGDSAGGRPDDMVALISFARYADSLCPLTLDHGNLALIVEDLQIVDRQDEDGTAIGEGLALAVERLRRHQAKSKVVILLTDGANNVDTIDPQRAAELAASHDIKVYCIGVGTDGPAPFPVRDPFTGRIVLRQIIVELDEQTLQQIAETTGGRYFRATDSDGLARIYSEIDRLERTKITEIRYLQYTEHYVSFVVAGLSLIAVAAVANGTVLRRIP